MQKLKTLYHILKWMTVSSLKWIWQAIPKNLKNVSFALNLLVLNYLVITLGFIPATSAYFSPLLERNQQIIVEKDVVEVEIEPTDPDVWVAWRIAKAGLNPLEAAVVQVNESGYTNNDNRFNINTNGSADLGRWQWNTLHVKSGYITIECAGNYRCATEKAIESRLKDGSWSVKWYGARKAGL